MVGSKYFIKKGNNIMKLQIDTIKSSVFLVKNLAETLKELSKEYNFDINDGGSFSTQFRLTKSKGD